MANKNESIKTYVLSLKRYYIKLADFYCKIGEGHDDIFMSELYRILENQLYEFIDDLNVIFDILDDVSTC